MLPAIMVQTVMFGGMATGVNLNTDIKKGDRFRSLPIARSAPLIGSVLGDLIRYVVAIVVLMGAGAALGFRVRTGLVPTPAACLLTIWTVVSGLVLLAIFAPLAVAAYRRRA
ncbi:hypothetical protein [Nonomuraea sp. NEAU-A123]|uniref:hypothetical protein n=1 Tax=Nonomuraea sp. NEAU-A123 TaxID=2839649 RepID=UPI001BE4A030|nr:hypothetical protein [Nonomuraea sp. NEAU-A123]MBT2225354.1 hypothetical protein [Nonomuraea sp. NEAU-A123]